MPHKAKNWRRKSTPPKSRESATKRNARQKRENPLNWSDSLLLAVATKEAYRAEKLRRLGYGVDLPKGIEV